MYKVRLFVDKRGDSPVADFIYKASKQTQLKITKQINYLGIFGLTRSNPNLKKLTGTPLWEVRILGKDSIRIICVALIEHEVMILNIFVKKTNKTPLKEIKRSMERYKIVIDN